MKKGFTLIELLAVIVILAVISLIAVPIILNVIEKSTEETNKINLKKYADSVELAITSYKMKENKYPTDFNEIESYIKNTGSTVDCKTKILYKDKTFYLAKCSINDSEAKYSYGKKQSYENGDVVYYDVSAGEGCSTYHEDNSKAGYKGINGTGNQNSCLKFYAFNDDLGETINLILDHNTTTVIEWNSLGINTDGPKEVINNLYNDTKDWKGTIIPSNYESKSSVSNYIIPYSEAPEGETEPYKARLITANEIAKITGADKLINWNEENSTNWYYLDGAKGTDSEWQTKIVNSTNPSEYYWLLDRTYNCTSFGCEVSDNSNYGYWTSSVVAGDSYYAWALDNAVSLLSEMVCFSTNYYGVRPVIEVLKSNL